ncbi:MAG TPA: hypothetical protein DCK79_05580 [Candidatus Atribacteria bacterium]|jgi:hypothetical protein|nr:hypothetical protein [Candidatus Atribacteria bacterium]
MQLGSVFIWNSFPFRVEGKEKNRYFVYFGESRYPDNPIKVFLITTTSRIYHYEEEGARKSHNYYRFKAGSLGFVEESILDVDSYYDIDKEVFEKHKEDIEEKGKLPETILKNIYYLILKSKNISIKVKQDIHYNYNLEGITGLKRPKRK